MKKVVIVILLIVMFILGTCLISPVEAKETKQEQPLEIWAENKNGRLHTACVVDKNTGVNYVVAYTFDSCHHYSSISVTPRLNADGSLYVSK